MKHDNYYLFGHRQFMNGPRSVAVISLLSGLLLADQCLAQGTFQNLDFGLPQVPSSTQPGYVAASLAIPFWTAYAGTNQLNTILYNSFDFNSYVNGSAEVILLSPDSPLGNQIPGHYTISLWPKVPAAIAQTAQIPTGTRSLLFVARTPPLWEVTLGGQNIPVVELYKVSPSYNEYAADISSFAGLTEELRFTALGLTPAANLDVGQIQFSPVAVPEPSVLPLVLLGISLISARAVRLSGPGRTFRCTRPGAAGSVRFEGDR